MPAPVQAIGLEGPQVALALRRPCLAAPGGPADASDRIADVCELPVARPVGLRHRLQENRERAACDACVRPGGEDEHAQDDVADAFGLGPKCVAAVELVDVRVMEAEVDLRRGRRGHARRQDRAPRRRRCGRRRQRGEGLGATQVRPRHARRQRLQRDLGPKKAPAHGERLGELARAEVRPTHSAPEFLEVAIGAHRLVRRTIRRSTATLTVPASADLGLVAAAAGRLGAGTEDGLRPGCHEIEDGVLTGDKEVVCLEDVGKNLRRKAKHRRVHLRVRKERLELPHDEFDGAVADLAQSRAVVRVRDVEPAILLE
mmetsp:Transcript_38681/g.111775  ORF Transcript_38681/g.111775 Transcript_38681/m.111775 type:complete len:315 (-) Transcript_38681:612-1556(-)